MQTSTEFLVKSTHQLLFIASCLDSERNDLILSDPRPPQLCGDQHRSDRHGFLKCTQICFHLGQGWKFFKCSLPMFSEYSINPIPKGRWEIIAT